MSGHPGRQVVRREEEVGEPDQSEYPGEDTRPMHRGTIQARGITGGAAYGAQPVQRGAPAERSLVSGYMHSFHPGRGDCWD